MSAFVWGDALLFSPKLHDMIAFPSTVMSCGIAGVSFSN
jgi:hypothetical protein